MPRLSVKSWAGRVLPALAALATAGGTAARDPDVAALTRGFNASGLGLYRELARASGNVVLSPYSIGSAMAMVRSGARGETEREMAAALEHSLGREAADAANAAVLAILRSYDKSADPGYCPDGMRWAGGRCEAAPAGGGGACPPLATLDGGVCAAAPGMASARLVAANALALPKDAGGISASYTATLRDKYAAAVLRGAGADRINAWVAQTTAGKIDRIVDRLPPGAGPVLLNAVYLKAAWASPFPEVDTREDNFSLSASQRVRVAMMHQQAELALAERAGYRAVRLAYAPRSLAMLVVLPDELDGLDRVAGRFDADELDGLRAALDRASPRLVALALPRFKVAFSADLVPPLRKAGMRLAFGQAADFSGMTGRKPGEGGFRIAAIRHRAVIEVEERGTEAAAATSVMMTTAAPFPPPQPVPFVVDRPFLFLVVDETSGAVLFQGRVADPRR